MFLKISKDECSKISTDLTEKQTNIAFEEILNAINCESKP